VDLNSGISKQTQEECRSTWSRRMQTLRFLYRREASDYLLTRHGLEVSAEHLARLANAGGGPRFRLLAGRPTKAVYTEPDLDSWATTYLGPLVARVCQITQLTGQCLTREWPHERRQSHCRSYSGRTATSSAACIEYRQPSTTRRSRQLSKFKENQRTLRKSNATWWKARRRRKAEGIEG
jgi:hypothetical protein